MSKSSDEISTWLTERGFPLEMRTARAFAGSGVAVRQGSYYRDHESNQVREIDIVATNSRHPEGAPPLVVACAVECKRIPGLPFVGLGNDSDDYHLDEIWELQSGTRVGNEWLKRSRKKTKELRNCRLTRLDNPVYSIVQCSDKRGERDFSYEACHSAAKAALALSARWENIKNEPIAEISIPVVVVEGQLFRAFLGRDGVPEAIEVGRLQLLWNYPHLQVAPIIIHIVEESQLGTFVDDFNTFSELLLAHEQAASEAHASIRRVGGRSARVL